MNNQVKNVFNKIAHFTSHAIGSPLAFILAVCSIIIWAIMGPVFHYSDTWQLVINTATTVVTFLIVFLIQNTQNRDSHALHVKLDELIRSNKAAHNQFIGLEKLTDAELEELQRHILKLEKKEIK